jgi:gluconate 2-dehydrogenase gamma chain
MKSLREWTRRYSADFLDQLPQNWQRRAFLRAGVKTATAVALAPLLGPLSGCSEQSKTTEALTRAPWPTIAAVQAHLFPQDGVGPGAADINAAAYLYSVLQTPNFDVEEKQFILDGVNQLDQVSHELQQQPFLALTSAQRETVLQEVATYRVGDRWLGALLTYILEALLSDPVYGGNPDGSGWRWLEHTPGFPRPPTPYTQRLK